MPENRHVPLVTSVHAPEPIGVPINVRSKRVWGAFVLAELVSAFYCAALMGLYCLVVLSVGDLGFPVGTMGNAVIATLSICAVVIPVFVYTYRWDHPYVRDLLGANPEKPISPATTLAFPWFVVSFATGLAVCFGISHLVRDLLPIGHTFSAVTPIVLGASYLWRPVNQILVVVSEREKLARQRDPQTEAIKPPR